MTDGICILLAEDDENDVLFMERAMKKAGVPHPLRVVCDGQEAIEYLAGEGKYADRAANPLPRLMILDLKMPRKTGMDVLRWLKEKPVLECLPKVILSSSANRRDVERGYRLGANAFLIKPSTVEERVELVKIIHHFWLQLNQPPLIITDGPEAVRAFIEETDNDLRIL
jgi:CheY-like chemotaxis protein